MKRILVLHDWMHSANRYLKLKEDLESNHNCIVDLYEFSGFGSTPCTYEKRLLDYYVRDLCIHLSENNYDIIVAHSMGGRVVLEALNGITTDTKLILLNPVYAGLTKIKPLIIFKYFLKLVLSVLQRTGSIGNSIIRIFSKITVLDKNLIDDLMISDVKRSNARIAVESLFDLAFDKWKVKEWKGSTGVILLAGEKDLIIDFQNLKLLQRHLKSCNLRVIPNIGHTPILENYEEVVNTITSCFE